MNKFILLFIISLGLNTAHTQCSGNAYFNTYTLNNPCVNVATSTISTGLWFGDYIIINNLSVGATMTLTISGSGCITVRTGSSNGPLVINGISTVTFTTTTTSIYVLYNANCSSCGTGSTNRTGTMKYTPPPTPKDCEGATQICNNTSFSANSSGKCNTELTAPLGISSFNGACYPNGSNPTTIGSPAWNTEFTAQKSACESTYGVGNCILNGGGSGTGCGGGQSRYRFDFYINPPGSNTGCLASGENQSSWYYLNVEQAGALTMTLAPNNSGDDYDFAIWGPYNASSAGANCPPIQGPTRCSWDASPGNTGMASGQTDNSEGAFGGNSFVAPLNTAVGDVYILLVDNFSNSGQPYGITWGGSAVLGCTPISLAAEVTDFTGSNIGSKNVLNWETASENNINYFEIERSDDGTNWIPVGTLTAINKLSTQTNYRLTDESFERKMNYYRLNEVNFSGQKIKIKTLNINNSLEGKVISKIINTMGQEVSADYNGVVIYLYEDGTTFKTVQ